MKSSDQIKMNFGREDFLTRPQGYMTCSQMGLSKNLFNPLFFCLNGHEVPWEALLCIFVLLRSIVISWCRLGSFLGILKEEFIERLDNPAKRVDRDFVKQKQFWLDRPTYVTVVCWWKQVKKQSGTSIVTLQRTWSQRFILNSLIFNSCRILGSYIKSTEIICGFSTSNELRHHCLLQSLSLHDYCLSW